MEKVIDPKKIVTDKLVLRTLARLNIDKNFVEFTEDYTKENPSAKFYQVQDSKKRIAVISSFPRVTQGGDRIVARWLKMGDRFESAANVFFAAVQGTKTAVTKEEKSSAWSPQIYLKLPGLIKREILAQSETPVLLPTDPVNSNYRENVLEWNYGICRRRLRIIEGGLIERFIFESDPGGDITIKSNWSGSIRAAKNWGKNAFGDSLIVTTSGDSEIIKAEEFAEPKFYKTYPAASTTDNDLGRFGQCTGCGKCGTWDFAMRMNQGKSLDEIKVIVDKIVARTLNAEIIWALAKDRTAIPAECGFNLTKDGIVLIPVISSLMYPIVVASSPETFNPTVDGYTYQIGTNISWSALHDGVGNGSNKDETGTAVQITSGNISAKWTLLYRALISLLTSALPDDAEISDAVLTLYGITKENEFEGDQPEINVYGLSLGDPSDIVNGDYDGVSDTPFSNNITYAAFNANGENNFILNQDGIDAISKIGYTQFSIREAVYDVANQSPQWANLKELQFGIGTTEAGAPYVPKLVVTYNVPGHPAMRSHSGIPGMNYTGRRSW